MQFNVIKKEFLFGLILLFIVSMIYTIYFNYPKHKYNREVKDIDQQGNITQQGYIGQQVQRNKTERKHFAIIQDISYYIKDQFTGTRDLMMQFNVMKKKFLFGLILIFIVSMIYTMHCNNAKQKYNREVKDIDPQGNITQQGYTSQQGNKTERKHFAIIQDISYNIKDQFTVVIMTHKREKQLIRALKHLNGLQSLHKTIIVWNDPEQSPPDFTYLNLTYEIQCIKQRKNSMNNRFLIYEEIKTEAILCLDDDVFIEHRVIDLCFRVWKSDKYALVGIFPRSHKWSHTEQKWQYSTSSCPTSMVLLGGAFYNKIYNYMYRTWMAKEILQFVDDIFNCDDLAMNFLVANLTGRPPIRVNYITSAQCQACSSNLSLRKSHYTDRSKCLNTLSTIYGYMPLLYTYNSVEIGEKVAKCLV